MPTTRICPRCGNQITGTLDRCPHDGTPLLSEEVEARCLEKDPARRFANTDELCDAPNTRVTDRAFLRDAQRTPGIEMSGIDLSKASTRPKLQRGTELNVDIPDEHPAERVRRGEDLSVFDSMERPGSSAQDDASLREDTMWLRRNRGNQVARFALVGGLVALGAGLGTWALLRPSAKAPLPAPTAAPVTTPAPTAAPPPAPTTAPAPAPTAAMPAAAPAEPRKPTPPPTPAAVPAARPAPVVAAKSPERAPSKSAGVRSRPSTLMYGGVPVPAALMPKDPEPPPAPAPAAPEPPPPAATTEDADAFLRKAQQAWLNHYYAVAIENAREVLKLKPNSAAAYQIITACSCSIGEAAEAREAASHLDDKRRKLALSVCERKGIKIDD